MNNSTYYADDKQIPAENYTRATIYIAVFIFGSIGNIFVLLIIQRKRVRRFNDIFIANLAVSDLGMIFFCIPVFTHRELTSFKGSMFYCKGIWPMITISLCSSVFTITVMAVYRCRVILHPFEPPLQKRKLFPMIGGIWFVSIALAFPMLLLATYNDGAEDCTEQWPSDTHRRIYTSILMFSQYFLPLLIIAVAYVLIAIDLTKSKTQPPSLKGSGKAIGHARREENIRVIKILATIVLVFALCMLPGHIAWMLLHFGGEKELGASEHIFQFSDVLAIIHSSLNPVIYGTLTKRFRQGYMKYLSYLFCCRFCGLSGKTTRGLKGNRTSEMRTFGSEKPSMDDGIEEWRSRIPKILSNGAKKLRDRSFNFMNFNVVVYLVLVESLVEKSGVFAFPIRLHEE